MLHDAAQTLSNVELFSGLSANALEKLGELMDAVNFQAGSTILQEGKFGDELFILVKGRVSIYKSTPDQDVFKVAVFREDSFPAFGEGGLIEAESRSATIICDSDCKCLVLKKENLEKFSAMMPEAGLPIYRKITHVILQRLRATSRDLLLLHKALMDEVRG